MFVLTAACFGDRMVVGGCGCWCLAFVVFLLQVLSVLMEEECIEL